MNIRPDQLYALLHGEHWTGMTLFLLLILSTHRTSVHYIITYPIHACISLYLIHVTDLSGPWEDVSNTVG